MPRTTSSICRCSRPTFRTLIVDVTERSGLAAARQCVRPHHVGDIVGSADDRMHQARSGIDADVGLHVEVPVIAFLRLVHRWITFATLVFD